MAVRLRLWWALFVASVKMFIRNRAALFFSLFLPLVIMLIFGVLNFEGSTTIDLGVVDEAGTDASAAFIDELGEFEYLVITEGSRDDELAALEEGDRDFVLVIPPDFEAALGGETGLIAYGGTADPAQAQVAQGLLQQAVGTAMVASLRRLIARCTGSRSAGHVRVGRVARPRLHRLPGARHHRHDRHAARHLRRRLRVRTAQADRRPSASLRHAHLAGILPLGAGHEPSGPRLPPGRDPDGHRHLVRPPDVRLVVRARGRRGAGPDHLPGHGLRRRRAGPRTRIRRLRWRTSSACR